MHHAKRNLDFMTQDCTPDFDVKCIQGQDSFRLAENLLILFSHKALKLPLASSLSFTLL